MEKNKVKIMVETGIAVALAAVLQFIPLWKMPQGGSISLEMLPILYIAIRWGLKAGMIGGTVYGLVQLFNPYVVHPVQLLLDYPVPYMLLGLAGIYNIRNNDYGKLLLAVLTGGLARFSSHLLSGAIFFGQYAPEGQNPWVYSAIYNASYIIPSLLLSYIILLPLLKKLPGRIK